MGVFVRAVVTGFGFSLGASLFKRLSKRLGMEKENTVSEETKDHNQGSEPAPPENDE